MAPNNIIADRPPRKHEPERTATAGGLKEHNNGFPREIANKVHGSNARLREPVGYSQTGRKESSHAGALP